jgi:oligopeptide transport system permease protein
VDIELSAMNLISAAFNFILKLTGITMFVYLVLYFTPGQMAITGVMEEKTITKALSGYASWAANTLRGDMGHFKGVEVGDRLQKSVPKTLLLVIGALGISLVLALVLALASLTWRGNLLVQNIVSLFNLVSGVHLIVLSFVVVLLGLALLIVLALGNGTLVDYYAVLREQMSRALGQNYVAAAMGRGASPLRHATVFEIALGIVDATSSRVPALVGGTIIVEWVFAYFGLGYDIIRAIQYRDFALIMGVTTAVAVLLIMVTEVAQLLRQRMDPRLG